jgi:hypothetical protein
LALGVRGGRNASLARDTVARAIGEAVTDIERDGHLAVTPRRRGSRTARRKLQAVS